MQLFVRLSEDLTPLVFEIPTELVTHLDLLKQLGAGETATVARLIELLQVSSPHQQCLDFMPVLSSTPGLLSSEIGLLATCSQNMENRQGMTYQVFSNHCALMHPAPHWPCSRARCTVSLPIWLQLCAATAEHVPCSSSTGQSLNTQCTCRRWARAWTAVR